MCFSTREKEVLKILGCKKMTIRDIAKQMNGNDKLLDPEISVSSYITRIIKKCEYHNKTWTLVKERKNKKLTIKRGRYE